MYPHSGETGGSSIAAARKLNGSFDSRRPFHELFSRMSGASAELSYWTVSDQQ